MITKILISNLIVLITMVMVDKHLLDDAIEHSKYAPFIFGLWGLISIVSISAWFIYWG